MARRKVASVRSNTNQVVSEESLRDFRIDILNSFLMTPHRDMKKIEGIHSDVLVKDPLFYGHLGSWYFDKGEIRDHKIAFLGNLLTSSIPEHREAGYVLLQPLPPEQVSHVVKFIFDDLSRWTKKGLPTSGFKAVKSYLKEIESNEARFDGAAVRMRKHMTYLYIMSKTKPNDRARAILFDRNPPKGSKPWVVKELSKVKDPSEQAKWIVKNKIPYPVASSVVQKMTPSIIIALVSSMTPQEVINNLGSLKEHGAMKNPDIKKLIEDKIGKASKDKRVTMLKTRKGAEAVKDDQGMVEKLEAVRDDMMSNKAVKITRSTGLLIDVSGSMSQALRVGREIAALLGASCENDLFVYAFNTMPYPIIVETKKTKPTLSDWEKATKNLVGAGGTSIGCSLEFMIRSKQRAEQFIIVSDQEENTRPLFTNAYDKYCKELAVEPSMWFVRVGSARTFVEDEMKKQGKEVGSFDGRHGDYYSWPGFVTMLSKPSILDLLFEIMDYPLPVRKDLHPESV